MGYCIEMIDCKFVIKKENFEVIGNVDETILENCSRRLIK